MKTHTPTTITRQTVIEAFQANDGSFAKLAALPDFDPKVLAEKDPVGMTVVHLAAKHGHLDQLHAAGLLTEELLAEKNISEWNCAHIAAEHGHLDQLHATGLLSHDLLAAKGISGWNCAHWAAEYGHLNQLQDAGLLSHDLLAEKDNDGWNCAHIAAKRGCLADLQLCKEYHLDFTEKAGNTPAMIAKTYGYSECASFCEQAEQEKTQRMGDETLEFLESIPDEIRASGPDSMGRIVRWIPVEERLPEGEEVLSWDGEEVSTFFPNTGTEDGNQALARCKAFGITHWMPLPDPPNAAAKHEDKKKHRTNIEADHEN